MQGMKPPQAAWPMCPPALCQEKELPRAVVERDTQGCETCRAQGSRVHPTQGQQLTSG